MLIVEDDPDDRHLLVFAFRKLGVTDPIYPLSDGSEAISYLNGEGKFADREQFHFPGFVITDLKMSPVDGFTIVQHIKSNPEWAVIPTIVLSGSSDTDDIKKAYLVGANSYLIKPNDFSELTVLLKKLYDYWMSVEVPEIRTSGEMKQTESRGKLGERIPQPGRGCDD